MKSLKICLSVLLVLFVGFIALGFFVSNDEKPAVAAKEEPKKEEGSENEAIGIIKARYVPSDQLMALNPDAQESYWSARRYPEPLCNKPNCWKVDFSIKVMPSTETKTVEAEWLIDMSTREDWPENTEARIMFSPSPDYEGKVVKVASESIPEVLIFPNPPSEYTGRSHMLTRALGSAPGAMLCSRSERIDSALKSPYPQELGCMLIKPGVDVLARPIGDDMDVVMMLSDRTTIHGVTRAGMLASEPDKQEPPASTAAAPEVPVNPPSTSAPPTSH